jgi:LacI family transcriptional regulator
VAERAGVSLSTASRVINRDARISVSKVTRERIWQIVRETGYESRVGPRKTDHRPQIGYVLTATKEKFEDAFLSKIIRGIEQELIEKGCTLAISCADSDLKDPTKLDEVLASGCDGLILVGGLERPIYDQLVKGIPHCVSLFEVPDDNMIDCVTLDYERYSYKMVRLIVACGHREIAFIGGGGYHKGPEEYRPDGLFYDHEGRLQGYLKALFDSGIAVNPRILKDGRWDIEVAYNKMNEILDGGERVTAVFAAGDRMAIGAMRAIRERGLEVPEDFSVAGFDDISVSAYLAPPLTTVSHPMEELGRAAARKLLENIRNKRRNGELPVKIIYPCSIEERKSVRKLNESA